MMMVHVRDVIEVGYDTCTYAKFHNALQKCSLREIDDFDVTFASVWLP